MGMGDHQTTSPCKFEHCAGDHHWLMAMLSLGGGGNSMLWKFARIIFSQFPEKNFFGNVQFGRWAGGVNSTYQKNQTCFEWPENAPSWFSQCWVPPLNSTFSHTHIQTDGDHTKHVVQPCRTTHLKIKIFPKESTNWCFYFYSIFFEK